MFNRPIQIDLKIQRRADFRKVLQAKNLKGDIVNLNDYATIASQVWDFARTTKFADAIITNVNASEGLFEWKLTDEMTASFLDLVYYDILFVQPDGERFYFFEGKIFADQGYSA